jgi:uncharacterized RDD family membrane protein YckC
MEWYYANGGRRTGPVSAVAFEGLVRDRIVHGETLVWTQGMAEWQPWSQVEPTTGACAASNGRFLRRDMVAYEGQLISAEQKETYFQRVREGVAQPGQMVYGGFWIRFLAKVLDSLLMWVVNTALNLLISFLFFGRFIFEPDANEVGQELGTFLAYQGVTFLTNLGTGLLFVWFFLSRYAATPGKMALGLKVVRADGSALGNGRIIGRYFAEILSGLILGIGYIMAAFDAEKRTLHDRICDTRVIKSR